MTCHQFVGKFIPKNKRRQKKYQEMKNKMTVPPGMSLHWQFLLLLHRHSLLPLGFLHFSHSSQNLTFDFISFASIFQIYVSYQPLSALSFFLLFLFLFFFEVIHTCTLTFFWWPKFKNLCELIFLENYLYITFITKSIFKLI